MLGLSLLDEAISHNDEIVAIIRKNSSKKDLIPDNRKIKVVEGNIDELDFLKLPGNGYDCFYYFMWEGTTGKERNDKELQANNIQHSLDAISLAKKYSCKKFVGAGSQAEYGIKSVALTSDTATDPVSEYGRAKLLSGLECAKFAKNHDVCFNWVRILSAFGFNDGPNTLISMLIRKLYNKEEINLTKCEQLWDYLYCRDAAKAFYAISTKGIDGKTYVLGSGKSFPLRYSVETIKDIIDKNAVINYGAVPYSENQVMYLKADISDLQKDTGWKPETSFEMGINEIHEKKQKIKNSA